MATAAPATPSTSTERDWTKPQAMAIPKEGYFPSFKKVGTAQYIHELQPAMDLPSSRKSNREGKSTYTTMARPSRKRSPSS